MLSAGSEPGDQVNPRRRRPVYRATSYLDWELADPRLLVDQVPSIVDDINRRTPAVLAEPVPADPRG